MAVQGGFAGGLFAIFVPSPKNQVTTADNAAPVSGTAPGAPVPPPLDLATAQAAVSSMASILIRIEREANGRVRICRTVEDIRHCIEAGVLAAVLHIEGAEAIDPEFETLDVLHQAGLRSLGPVWSRPNAFGHGVPFRCPSSPDTGPGLTDLGKELVRACNRLKILIDLSHLNEKRLLGRRRAQRRAAGRHAFQRPRLEPAFAQPHRQATGGDPRNERHGRREFRGELPARPTAARTATRRSSSSSIMSST